MVNIRLVERTNKNKARVSLNDLEDWEARINAEIEKIHLDGGEVNTLWFTPDYCAIAYDMPTDVEIKKARAKDELKNVAGDLIKDQLKGFGFLKE